MRRSNADNQLRARILAALEEEPALSISALCRALGVTHQTATYHLDVLLGAGLITAYRQGTSRIHFVNGSGYSKADRQLLSVATHEATLGLLFLIEEAPWLTRSEAALSLGLTRTAGAWHINKLVRSGLVHECKEGNHAFLYVDKKRLRILIDLLRGPGRRLARACSSSGAATGSTQGKVRRNGRSADARDAHEVAAEAASAEDA